MDDEELLSSLRHSLSVVPQPDRWGVLIDLLLSGLPRKTPHEKADLARNLEELAAGMLATLTLTPEGQRAFQAGQLAMLAKVLKVGTAGSL